MKFTWLGQAGLLFDNGCARVMIDPYFSDSVAKVQPKNFRRVPVHKALFDLEPEIMIFTHDHGDHYDPETVSVFLGGERLPKTVLAPNSVWQKARLLGKQHNYVLFDRHSEWTACGFRFRAVKAAHSDPWAIGIVLEDLLSGRVCYITGDTLFNREIFADLPEKIDAVFLPVNGVGNNMNAEDAVRFSRAIGAKAAIPLHVGMFDELSPEIFTAENRILPALYQEMEVSL